MIVGWVALKAYTLDFADMLIIDTQCKGIIDKQIKTRKENKDKDLTNRLESAKDAWKILGLENL